MTSGVERRSQIDTETVKALLLINGGGAIALLTTFSQIIGKSGYEKLAPAILIAILFLIFGLMCAVVHNRLRRMCSLHYEHHNMRPPRGRLFGFELWEPTICSISTVFLWLSVAAFIFAGSYVACRGIVIADAVATHQTFPCR